MTGSSSVSLIYMALRSLKIGLDVESTTPLFSRTAVSTSGSRKSSLLSLLQHVVQHGVPL